MCLGDHLVAVAVAAQLVDFAIGIDTVGCLRMPAAFCGILGFRPSHGLIKSVGVIPNSQSLDTIGWFARDPFTLHHVGRVLLQFNRSEPKRVRRLIIADDLFQLSEVPKWKTIDVLKNVVKNLTGFPQHKPLHNPSRVQQGPHEPRKTHPPPYPHRRTSEQRRILHT